MSSPVFGNGEDLPSPEEHAYAPTGYPLVPCCGLCLLGNLLDHPKEEIGDRLLDPEPFQLGGNLATVVGGVIDNMAERRPRRQGCRAAAPTPRQHGVEPLWRERGTQLLEAAVGTLQQPGRVVYRGQI